ncbi:MAG: hemerythrin domain-containing protein [Steroidobacteraceae bacterium]
MSLETSADPIGLLLEEHLAFGDLFARHQEALLDRRFDEAASLLEAYTERLRAHIAYEESCVLPQCASRGDARWPPEVYRAEHRRIEQLLAKASDRLRGDARGGITTAALISMLDEERTLKRLVEHHHEREEAALFQEVYRAGCVSLDRREAGRPS